LLVTNCFAYSDVNVELWQCKEAFVLALKAPDNENIHLTLSYSQIKVLADALRAMHQQAPIRPLLETEYGRLLGGMTVKLVVSEEQEPEEKKEAKVCQQNNLSARMKPESLSESA